MQIKATMKHHYTPMRMAKIKKALTLGKVLMGLESKYTLLLGVWNGAATLENSLAVSYQVNIHSPYELEKWNFQFTQKCHTLETIQMPSSGEWVNKVWYIHTKE